MTSDGISADDWGDAVKALAAEAANAALGDDDLVSESITQELLLVLGALEEKYGRKPSILATRADYVSDVSESIALLEEAYSLAYSADDLQNMTYTTSSLAELYVEILKDYETGSYWLALLEHCLKSNDSWERQELERLKRIVIESE